MLIDPNESRDDLGELLKYPVLTREVGMQTPVPGGTPAALPGTAPLSQLVEGTLRGVLGWRLRRDDPRGFLAALAQSFTGHDVEGRREFRWTPRGSAVVAQASLGSITGPQASLHTRAAHTLEKVLELLDGLRPLRSEPDPEDVHGMRSIIRGELTELVNELGTVGGPRIARVDQIFDLLLGGTEDEENPESLAGQLALLQERFGLQRNRINTVEEEKVYSDFLTLVDYIRSLAASWTARRDAFRRDGPGEAFLGTQLVLLARELAVTGESVEEVQFALDSIFLGAAERATLLLRFDGTEAPVTLAELLDWIHAFVTREAPRLLDETGKDGIVAFHSTLERLYDLVSLLLQHLPGRLNVPRVVRALKELRDHLNEMLTLAGDIQGDEPPELPDNPVSPATGRLGEVLDVEIQGLDKASIGSPDRLSFGEGVTVQAPLHDLPAAPPERPLRAVRARIAIGAHAGRGERPVVLDRDRVVGYFQVQPVGAAQEMLTVQEVTFEPSPGPAPATETTVNIRGTGFIHDPASNRRIGIAFGKGAEDATLVPDGIKLERNVSGALDLLTVRVVLKSDVKRIRISNPDGQRVVWIKPQTTATVETHAVAALPPAPIDESDEIDEPGEPPRPVRRRPRPRKK